MKYTVVWSDGSYSDTIFGVDRVDADLKDLLIHPAKYLSSSYSNPSIDSIFEGWPEDLMETINKKLEAAMWKWWSDCKKCGHTYGQHFTYRGNERPCAWRSVRKNRETGEVKTLKCLCDSFDGDFLVD